MKKFKLWPIIFTILFAVLLTWILPITYYQGAIQTAERTQVGIFDLLSYPNVSIEIFKNIALYVLVIGAFYGVLHSIPAYRTVLEKITSKAKGKEVIIISAIAALIAILTSVCGVSTGIWFVLPFVISLVIMMGYDKITAALVTAGSIAVGIMGTTLSSTYVGDGYSMPTQNGMGVVNAILETKATTLIIPKIIILVIGIALITALIVKKSKSIKKSKEGSELLPQAVDNNQKVWPLIVIFDLIFVVMILSLISWTSVFNVNIFSKATEYITTKATIFKFPLFGKILGTIVPFENWGVNELTSVLALATIVLALVYKVNLSEFTKNIKTGMQKALKPATVIILIYVVLVIVSYNPVILTILKPILRLTTKLNPITAAFAALLSSIFNVDIYYSSMSTLPYVVELFGTSGALAFIWQTMNGFATLIAPTSIVLMVTLSYLDIPYKKWFKENWILIVGMFVVSIITSLIIVL